MATDPNSQSQATPPQHAKLSIHRYCCCCLPVTRSHASSISTWWRSNDDKWWGHGVRALMKIREWSELVAGPRWKTFIRRFNRTRSGSGGRLNGPFNYDPLSYSLNFDEGPGQNSEFEVEGNYDGSRDFSARYAAVPADRGIIIGFNMRV